MERALSCVRLGELTGDAAHHLSGRDSHRRLNLVEHLPRSERSRAPAKVATVEHETATDPCLHCDVGERAVRAARSEQRLT